MSNVSGLVKDFLSNLLSSPDSTEECEGVIVQAGSKDFAFIGDVTDSQGRPIDTGTGDVFLGSEDLKYGRLEVGTRLRFKLIPDTKRKNAVRAIDAHKPEVALANIERIVQYPVSVRTGDISLYQARARKVDPKLVHQAEANRPFAGMKRPSTEDEARDFTNQDVIAQVIQLWFAARFAMFADFDVNYDITKSDGDENEEAEKIETFATKVSKGQMQAAGQKLREEYVVFQHLRRTFRYLYGKHLLMPQSVVSMRYLPHLFMAAPVWFFRQACTARSPLEFFPSLVNNGPFTKLFSLYNYRSMQGGALFDAYSGDIIPPSIWEIIEQNSDGSSNSLMFDHLVIATPYHQLASDFWTDAEWRPRVDPYLLAFSRHIPEFFLCLGRWSDTGLFPGVEAMIGDTIDNIAKNRHKLAGSKSTIQVFKDGLWPDVQVKALDQTAGDAIKHFEEGTLFPWLAGEIPDEPIKK